MLMCRKRDAALGPNFRRGRRRTDRRRWWVIVLSETLSDSASALALGKPRTKDHPGSTRRSTPTHGRDCG